MNLLRIGSIAALFVGGILGTSAGTAYDAPIQTSVCEIVRDPARFNGKIIQLRAIVDTGLEWSVLRDESCPNDTIHLAFGDDKHPSLRDRAEFAYIGSPEDVNYPASLQWHPNPPKPRLKLRQDSEFRTLAKHLRKREDLKKSGCLHCPVYKVVATVTGGFEASDGRLKALRDRDGRIRVARNGFGHLNGWDAQILLESVADVSATRIRRKSSGRTRENSRE